MLLARDPATIFYAFLSKVTRQVCQYFRAHRLLLAICQVPVSGREHKQELIIKLRNASWIDWDQLVLLIPVSHPASLPGWSCALSFGTAFVKFHPEEKKPAIALRIDLAAVEDESLCDGCLHLRRRTSRGSVDISADPMASVHDEGACVHSPFRRADKILPVRFARPRCVNVRIRVEDRG